MDQRDTWFRNLEGRIFKIKALNMSIKMEEQLTEITDPRIAQMHVLTHVRVQETGSRVMVKIRYDLNPEEFGIEDVEKNKAIVDRHIDWKIDIMDQLADIGHGPEHMHSVRYKQGPTFAYPGGYGFVMVMKQAPGEDVEKIRNQLSGEKLHSIRKQLAYILNELARSDSESAPRPAGSLPYHSRRHYVENEPTPRQSPQRRGPRTPSYVVPREILSGSRGSPLSARPQVPRESPSGAVEGLSDLLQAATTDEMSGIAGRGGRGGLSSSGPEEHIR